MKNCFRKTIAIVVTLAVVMLVGLPAIAMEDKIGNEEVLKTAASEYVQNWVNANYTEHYILSDYEDHIYDLEVVGDKLEVHLLVEMNTTLKYDTVEELPYMQGVKELVGVNSVENLLLDTAITKNVALQKVDDIYLTDIQKMNFVNKVKEQYEDAAACIGVATPLTVEFVLKADVVNGKLTNINLFENNEGILLPAEPYGTTAELKKTCVTKLKSYLMSEKSKTMDFETVRAGGYDRVAAKDYANQYTSTASGYCYCGDLKGVDYTKWNEEDYPYKTIFCHDDCADFVSQSLRAGGIPTTAGDAGWNRDADAWKVSSKLCNYMLDKGYAKETTFDDCVAGHFVRMTSENNHIVLCTLNDTISHRYSAHTRDKLNANLNNVSGWVYYRVTY